MRKRTTKILSLFLALALCFSLLAACGQSDEPTSPDEDGQATGPEENQDPEGEEEETEPLKVALLLSGPVNDMGFNSLAFKSLEVIEKEYGCQVHYMESVAQSDMQGLFKDYAEQDFDLVIGHGFQFSDSAKQVAPQYPDTKFLITSSNVSQEPNLASADIDHKSLGFLMGSVAGLLTETDKVGFIGGLQIPSIKNSGAGYKQGAEYVNPDVEVFSTFTDSFDDVNKAKEIALAMIGDDADVIMTNANQSGLGSIEACQQHNVLAIGANQDQYSIAPDTVVVSGMNSVPMLITYITEEIINGTFQAKNYLLGLEEGAIFLSPYHNFEDKLSDEFKAEIEAIQDGLEDGSIQTK